MTMKYTVEWEQYLTQNMVDEMVKGREREREENKGKYRGALVLCAQLFPNRML